MQQRTHLARSNTRTRIATTRPCGARLSHCHGAGAEAPSLLSQQEASLPTSSLAAGRRCHHDALTTPVAATSPLASPGLELASEPSLLEDAALAGREAARFWSVGAPPAARAAAARVAATAQRSRSTNSKHRMHVRQSPIKRTTLAPPLDPQLGVLVRREVVVMAASNSACGTTAWRPATYPSPRSIRAMVNEQ